MASDHRRENTAVVTGDLAMRVERLAEGRERAVA